MDFEVLRFIDLIEKFQADIVEVNSSHSLKKYKEAGVKLQSVYNFLLTSQNTFEEVQELVKNLFSAFNYGAVIVNQGIKNGKLTPDDNALLNECIEILLTCCTKIIKNLKK